MDSLTFTPGGGFLDSCSHVAPWCVVFEDEGVTGYLYAWDLSRKDAEQNHILDAVLIYNVSATGTEKQRIVSIQWSRSGLQAVLYFDGVPQALVDFVKRETYARQDFPNFVEQATDTWRQNSHAWDEAALSRFEADLYQ